MSDPQKTAAAPGKPENASPKPILVKKIELANDREVNLPGKGRTKLIDAVENRCLIEWLPSVQKWRVTVTLGEQPPVVKLVPDSWGVAELA